MIRMTLILLACIGVTMAVAGRDVNEASQRSGYGTQVSRAAADPAERGGTARLALDDEAGAIARALAATAAPASGGTSETTPAPATVNTVAAAPTEGLHAVTGNRVNLRSGPSTANPVVDQVVRDQRVEVLEETPDGWLRIRVMETGLEAYIFGRFVAPLRG